jgi:parallel beta-helix repeat protein
MFFGGCLSNGTIVGNNTKIVYSPKIFGDTLTISGTWAVDFICSDMLQSPFETNSLRKLNALMSDDCFNEVVIRPGTYYFEPDADGSALLSMASNTKLRIDGRIEVVPNGFPHNYVVYLNTKHHIDVFGSGTIHGDADEHDYITTTSTHEWCHAFQSMQGCHSVTIRDLNIENFPGDAACLSGDNLSISNLTIDHCGRQGISLEMCSNAIVSNCKISDIYRTAPKAAVDIEPWVSGSRASNIKLVGLDISDCTGILFINCDCVSIENINAKDCTRLFYGSGAKDVSIKNITSSRSGATPNDFIDVKNSCEHVFADCLSLSDEQGGSIDLANVRLGLSCFYNSGFMKPTSAAAGSVSYESGKYIQFNGTSWVNMDGTNL